MAFCRECRITITHLPTGLVASCDLERSIVKMRASCMSRLRGMLWALRNQAPRTRKLVRTYVIPDNAKTTHDLETGDCIETERGR